MTLSFAPDAIETWPLARLQPYAKNAKAHGADQVAKIAASMAEFGWTVPCLVAEDGELIAGHGRVLAATQLGLTEAPVIVLGHLTEAQRRAYRIADNKLTELGTWDEALLSAELNDLLAEDFDLSLVGFSDGELDKLLAYRAGRGRRRGRRRRQRAAGDHPRTAAQPGLADGRSLDPRRSSAALRRQHQRRRRAPPDERRAGDPVRDRPAVSRRLRRLEPSDAEQGLVASATASPGTTAARARNSTTASSRRPWPKRSPRTPPGTAGTPRAARRCWRPAGRRPAPSSTSRSSG